jgi:hypothetical protein
MNRLTLDVLPEGFMDTLKPSFAYLPQTDHADGKYRFRRYSKIDYYGLNVGTASFTQSSDYNKHQGDVDRKFDPVDDDILNSEPFKTIHLLFRDAGDLFFEDVEVHQMRIFTEGKTVPVSPEGVHQDGYHIVGIFGVHRHNIDGGDALVFMKQDGPPVLSRKLETGEYIILDDENLWHSAKEIMTIDKASPGYMDAFILTACRDES